jgi:non-heme chloroperoxidase
MLEQIIKRKLPPEQLHQLTSDCLRTPTSIGIAMLITDSLTVDRRPGAAKMTKPTLIIASAESDELAMQKQMQQSIPNARLEAVADAGHAVFLDQAEQFNRLINSFLREVERPADGGSSSKGNDGFK